MLYTLKLRRTGGRLISAFAGLAVLLVVCGCVAMPFRSGSRSDGPYYTPGVPPSRERCVLAKMKTYAQVTKQTLTHIAEACELPVLCTEGHRKLRKAGKARDEPRPPTPR